MTECETYTIAILFMVVIVQWLANVYLVIQLLKK